MLQSIVNVIKWHLVIICFTLVCLTVFLVLAKFNFANVKCFDEILLPNSINYINRPTKLPI